MKLANVILMTLALAAPGAFAAIQDWRIAYYAGTLKIRDLKTKKLYKEDVVMYHLNDTELDKVTQMACVSDDGGPAYVVPTHMFRNFDGTLNVTERTVWLKDSQLTGNATAQGRNWNWDNFTMTMKYVYNPEKPAEFKTMVADVEMKQYEMKVQKMVWDAKGKPKQKWTGSLYEISREKFLKIASDMKCPAIP